MKLIEIEPGRWRMERPPRQPARSDLPLPYVISDIMPETEHVNGKFYTSKRAFRAVTRALGCDEVGNEKQPPKQRSTNSRAVKEGRRKSIQTAIEKYKAGHRPGGRHV